MTASPTGSDILITPTDISKGIPAEGIDVFLGPDLQKRVKDTLKGLCKNGMSKECTHELSTILDKNGQFAIEARQLSALAVLGTFIAGIVGVGIGLANEKQPVKVDHWHGPSSKVAQIQSLTGSTVVATGAGSPITIALPAATTVKSATVTTLSADQGSHHKGDVRIDLPSKEADLLRQILAKGGAPRDCKPKSSRKRGSGLTPNYGGIDNIAVWALPMAAPGQLLNTLGMAANAQLPHLKSMIDRSLNI